MRFTLLGLFFSVASGSEVQLVTPCSSQIQPKLTPKTAREWSRREALWRTNSFTELRESRCAIESSSNKSDRSFKMSSNSFIKPRNKPLTARSSRTNADKKIETALTSFVKPLDSSRTHITSRTKRDKWDKFSSTVSDSLDTSRTFPFREPGKIVKTSSTSSPKHLDRTLSLAKPRKKPNTSSMSFTKSLDTRRNVVNPLVEQVKKLKTSSASFVGPVDTSRTLDLSIPKQQKNVKYLNTAREKTSQRLVIEKPLIPKGVRAESKGLNQKKLTKLKSPIFQLKVQFGKGDVTVDGDSLRVDVEASLVFEEGKLTSTGILSTQKKGFTLDEALQLIEEYQSPEEIKVAEILEEALKGVQLYENRFRNRYDDLFLRAAETIVENWIFEELERIVDD